MWKKNLVYKLQQKFLDMLFFRDEQQSYRFDLSCVSLKHWNWNFCIFLKIKKYHPFKQRKQMSPKSNSRKKNVRSSEFRCLFFNEF